MNKQQRRNKSATKLLRRQRKTLEVVHNVRLASAYASFQATVATIIAAKRLKAGEPAPKIASDTVEKLKIIAGNIATAVSKGERLGK